MVRVGYNFSIKGKKENSSLSNQVHNFPFRPEQKNKQKFGKKSKLSINRLCMKQNKLNTFKRAKLEMMFCILGAFSV